MPRIFIIDDDELLRRALGTQVSRLGFAVTAFESADAVLPHAGERPDLVFCDLNLPGSTASQSRR
jgi:CheY-like chemotaxis protein